MVLRSALPSQLLMATTPAMVRRLAEQHARKVGCLELRIVSRVVDCEKFVSFWK
eukprot:SAG31_NODE_25458_length_461_cov_0.715470_1_plen_53_part_10